jgi:type I site-specific restriction endonuclease
MPRQINEERTRKEMIDPQLDKAGWYLRDHSKVKIEIPVDGEPARRVYGRGGAGRGGAV